MAGVAVISKLNIQTNTTNSTNATNTTIICSIAGNISTSRSQHTASLLLNGTVLVTGGFNGATLNSAELCNPATGNWTYTGSMSVGREEFTASALSDGKVAELYDPATETWTTTGSMNSTREFHRASVLSNGQVLVCGGYNGGTLDGAELYDPTAL
ncbi:unnamed protein product [Rotaria magnacalcarata]|uniref:Uncharacterized protein n=2 Tax=Rotaria magnacalcarata TaxID=392030 RepID=A0A816DR55_9BILA|nr:unnamed protein product [Rotaria magnacalcarata]CAF1638017.1 unnamed protein product [Rotaria magnacalcarata]